MLAAHAFVYLAVNALLFAVNFLTTPGQWWVLFPVFFWGLGLLLHLGFGLSSGVSERRLTREKRRLLQAAGAGVARVIERRAGRTRRGLRGSDRSSERARADRSQPTLDARSVRLRGARLLGQELGDVEVEAQFTAVFRSLGVQQVVVSIALDDA